MTKEEFLKTGLCEQYVLGVTTPEENEIVEQMFKSHPELKNNCQKMEDCMGKYARNSERVPPRCLKKSISKTKSKKQFSILKLMKIIVILLFVSLLLFYLLK